MNWRVVALLVVPAAGLLATSRWMHEEEHVVAERFQELRRSTNDLEVRVLLASQLLEQNYDEIGNGLRTVRKEGAALRAALSSYVSRSDAGEVKMGAFRAEEARRHERVMEFLTVHALLHSALVDLPRVMASATSESPSSDGEFEKLHAYTMRHAFVGDDAAREIAEATLARLRMRPPTVSGDRAIRAATFALAQKQRAEAAMDALLLDNEQALGLLERDYASYAHRRNAAAEVTEVLGFGLLLGALLLGGFGLAGLKRMNTLLESRVQQRTSALRASLETLKSAQARMVESDRLATAGRLAASVAHEINNPISYVLGNLRYVHRELGRKPDNGAFDSPDILAALEECLEGAERVADVVRGMRSFARESDGRRAAVKPNDIVNDVLNLTRKEVGRHATISLDLQDVPEIQCDRTQLGQVVMNLIVNASQAMSSASANTLTVSTRCDGTSVILSVADTGMGMTDEVKSRIFEPFFTTKPVGEGTGLGLFICAGIVRAHGGEMQVESVVGKGTTFHLRLPVRAPGQIPAEKTETRLTSKPLVLLIDDDELVRNGLRRELANRYEVTVAIGARQAWAALESGLQPDAILCDLMMPDVDGEDCYHRIAEMRPELEPRVMFLTGGAFTPRLMAFEERFSGRVILKPATSEVLSEAIDRKIAAIRSSRPQAHVDEHPNSTNT